jgi:hypothetical protein
MLRRRRARAGFISALIGGALALSSLSAPVAGAAPTSAARTPAWHVAYRQSGFTVTGVTAGGPDNAWAYGYTTSSGLLLHWNGEQWTPVHYPAQYHTGYIITDAFVLSPTDVWFAGENEVQPLNARILQLRNGAWSWLPVPSSTNSADVDVLADNDIWSAGGQVAGCEPGTNAAGLGCTPLSRWNGSTWRSYPLHVGDLGAGVRLYGSAGTGAWATGTGYLTPWRGTHPPTFVEYAFRWTGSRWQQAVAGPRSGSNATLVTDSRSDVWLAEPGRSAPRSCAVHWNGKSWRPFYLPAGSGPCRDAVTDYRTGFWTAQGPGDFRLQGVVGFWFRHWTGKRYPPTPVYVPNKNSWNTDGFMIAAVPRTSRVWVYGDYCAVSRVCRNLGVIVTLS